MKNTNLLSENQSITIEQEADLLTNTVDLNYLGTEVVLGSSSLPFVVEKDQAVRNAVLFWLESSANDYIRQPGKGGPLAQAVGKAFNPQRIAEFRTILSSFFQSNFGGTLALSNLTIELDTSRRAWVIKMNLMDTIRRELQTVTVGVRQ